MPALLRRCVVSDIGALVVSSGPTGVSLNGASHNNYVREVAFSPDGPLLAPAGRDGYIKIWTPRDGSLLWKRRGHRAGAEAVAFDPSGTHVVSTGRGAVVRVWTTADGSEVLSMTNQAQASSGIGTA